MKLLRWDYWIAWMILGNRPAHPRGRMKMRQVVRLYEPILNDTWQCNLPLRLLGTSNGITE